MVKEHGGHKSIKPSRHIIARWIRTDKTSIGSSINLKEPKGDAPREEVDHFVDLTFERLTQGSECWMC